MNKEALVVGLGVAGERHSIILEELGFNVIQISRRGSPESFKMLSDRQFDLSGFRVIVIAVETGMHNAVFKAIQDSGYEGVVLIEKPGIVDQVDFEVGQSMEVRIAYNLRYLDCLLHLRRVIEEGNTPLRVTIACRSDLSKWRPGSDRENQYSKWLDLGGGALNDLSHELDYLSWVLGKVDYVGAVGGKLGNGPGDADNSWKIIGLSETAQISIDLSVISGKSIRTCLMEFEGFFIEIDLIRGTSFDSRTGILYQGRLISETYKLMLDELIYSHKTRLPDLRANALLLDDLRTIRSLSMQQGEL